MHLIQPCLIVIFC